MREIGYIVGNLKESTRQCVARGFLISTVTNCISKPFQFKEGPRCQ